MQLIINLSEWKYLVPKSQRSEVLFSSHDVPLSAHSEFYKTLGRVSEKIYWQKMCQDIIKYVRCGKMCCAQKASNEKRMGLMCKEKKGWMTISSYCHGFNLAASIIKKGKSVDFSW